MFKWLTDVFKGDRCECRGCMVTRYGWGYSPCSNKQVEDSTTTPTRSTKQPPRKI